MVKVRDFGHMEFNPQIAEHPDARIQYIYFNDPSKAIYAIVFPRKLTEKISNHYTNIKMIKDYLTKNGIFLKRMEEFGKYIKRTQASTSCIKDISKYLMDNGLYYLVQEDKDSNLVKSLYVGKTEDGVKRIIDHNQKKEWWDKVVIFFSNSDFRDVVRPLERYAIEQGMLSGQVFRNKNNSKAYISDDMIPDLKNIYADICKIMDYLGYSLSKEKSKKYLFHLKERKNIKLNAKMLYLPCKQYVLLPGSEIYFYSHHEAEGMLEKLRSWERKRLIERDEKDDKGNPLIMEKKSKTDNVYKLLVPKFFNNPTGPAKYVVGHEMNGPNYDKIENENKNKDEHESSTWINEDGIPLRDVIPKESN